MKKKIELGIDLPLFKQNAGETKQAWVYRSVSELIRAGTIGPATRLPSTRELAGRWALSRGIVDAAYDMLRQEGYVESRVGSGTWVSQELPDRFLRLDAAAPVPASVADQKPRADAPESLLHAFQVPFLARLADPELFPLATWRALATKALQRADGATLSEEDPAGHLPLRQQIAAYLGVARGIRCEAADIIVVTGIRHGIDLSAQLMAGSGRRVLVEDPGYPAAYAFHAARGNPVSAVAVDAQGFCVASARGFGDAGMAYVTPAHQSPLGMPMAPERCRELLAWAKRQDAWIFEDDYDSEFNYARSPLPALKAMDLDDRVLHCGSFNKTLLPALRIGYLVVPASLRDQLRQLRGETGRANSIFDQLALSAFLESGSFARHLRRARIVYQQRRDIVLDALRQALGARLRVSGEQGGFHFVLWLPPGWTEERCRAALKPHGIQVQFLSEYCHQTQLAPAVMLGFTAIQNAALSRAAAILGATLKQEP